MRQLICGVVAAVIVPVGARAQGTYDPAVDVQLFQWALGPKSFFSVADAALGEPHQLTLDAAFTFATNPLVVRDTDVVHQVTGMQIGSAYNVTRWLQIGAALPIWFDLRGAAYDVKSGSPMTNGLEVHGYGDLRLEAKLALWRRHRLAAALIVGGTIATSNGTENAQFTGDNSDSGRARLAGEWSDGAWTLGANAGVIVREDRSVYGAGVGDALTYGIAIARQATENFALVAEVFGLTGIVAIDSDQHPLEAVAGVRIFVRSSVAISAGGGAGLTSALGAPQAQIFLAAGYAPDNRDSDGDGVPNTLDRCPLVPEDRDGFQDEDGCPDDDNDGDRRPDKADKCPNEAEDLDGFEDEDGCPDLDNDKDGIPDLEDKCPNSPEDGKPPYPKDGCPASKSDADGDGIYDDVDKCPEEPEDIDGFMDDDGCPDLDNDLDGVPDTVDKCPLCPEDLDGFEDADGCPDLDNDNDGIPDSADKCPNQPETVNGVADEDGCPDTGGKNLVRLDGDQLVFDIVPALDRSGALTRASRGLLEQAALVIAGHAEVTKWLIAVAQPSQSTATKLAAAIEAELVRRGVTSQLTVLGRAGAAKLAGAVQERRDAAAPPVCPAGLEVHPRPAAGKP